MIQKLVQGHCSLVRLHPAFARLLRTAHFTQSRTRRKVKDLKMSKRKAVLNHSVTGGIGNSKKENEPDGLHTKAGHKRRELEERVKAFLTHT